VGLAVWFYVFFQAEDGIRVFHVTGVQTCALPIFDLRAGLVALKVEGDERLPLQFLARPFGFLHLGPAARLPPEQAKGVLRLIHRSEERRVGKERRGWRTASHGGAQNAERGCRQWW